MASTDELRQELTLLKEINRELERRNALLEHSVKLQIEMVRVLALEVKVKKE